MRPSSRVRRRSRGFTLIEMIVATILLALGVVASLACISAATRSTSVAAGYTTAVLLAQERIATLEADPGQLTGGEQQGDFEDREPGFSWYQSVEPSTLESVMKVTLVVEWPGGQGRRAAQFVTYLVMPEDETQQP